MLSIHKNKNIKGFTLIELLVVVAIIGLLSSVVLASLSSAREKARIAAIKSSVLEFRKLMELEHSDNNSYIQLSKGVWIGTGTSCTGANFLGNYATKAVEICNQLRSLVSGAATANDIFFGVNTAMGSGFNNTKDYSIMARISTGATQTYFCAGSSGRTSDLGIHGAFLATGCYGNP